MGDLALETKVDDSTALSTAKTDPTRKGFLKKWADESSAHRDNLLTDTQLGNDCTIAVDVLLCQIVQQVTTLTDHHQ